MKKFLFNYLLPIPIFLLFRLWAWTLRPDCLTPERVEEIRRREGPVILTFWHSRIYFLLYHFRFLEDVTLLVSPSEDGDIIAGLCRMMGYSVVRGSSFKKAFSGSRGLIEWLKKDRGLIGIVADGSRGPRHRVQAGSVQLARITGAQLYGMTYDADRKIEFNSWDRFLLPLPFSRCRFKVSPPISLPPDADDAEVRRQQEALTETLCRMTDECGFPADA